MMIADVRNALVPVHDVVRDAREGLDGDTDEVRLANEGLDEALRRLELLDRQAARMRAAVERAGSVALAARRWVLDNATTQDSCAEIVIELKDVERELSGVDRHG